jgi:hypothetical protein
MDGRLLTASTSLYLVEGLSPPEAELQQLAAADIGLTEFIYRAGTRISLVP